MPPKPAELVRGAGAEFYHIDFSLNHQLQLAGAAPPVTAEEVPRKLLRKNCNGMTNRHTTH